MTGPNGRPNGALQSLQRGDDGSRENTRRMARTGPRFPVRISSQRLDVLFSPAVTSRSPRGNSEWWRRSASSPSADTGTHRVTGRSTSVHRSEGLGHTGPAMKPSPEIEAIVRRLWSARARGDLDVLRAMWSRSEYLLIIGSDEHEWLEGFHESMMVASVQVEEWPIEESELLRVRAFERGDVGWAAFEERRTSPNDSTTIFRRTMVFILESGSWKIVQSHFSAPVPNLETAGVELTGTLSQLLESIGSDADVSLMAGQMSGTSTLLFTDIIDSTALSEEMGDVAWSHAIKDHLEVVRRVVEGEGGSVVKTLGDGGMYVFSSGSAALRAAVKIQQTVERSPDTRFRVRIGVHTGDVVQADGDYLGLTVNKAARVAAAADAGQILVSSTTAGLVGSEFEFGEPIAVELTGLAGTHELRPLHWRLTRTKPPAVQRPVEG